MVSIAPQDHSLSELHGHFRSTGSVESVSTTVRGVQHSLLHVLPGLMHRPTAATSQSNALTTISLHEIFPDDSYNPSILNTISSMDSQNPAVRQVQLSDSPSILYSSPEKFLEYSMSFIHRFQSPSFDPVSEPFLGGDKPSVPLEDILPQNTAPATELNPKFLSASWEIWAKDHLSLGPDDFDPSRNLPGDYIGPASYLRALYSFLKLPFSFNVSRRPATTTSCLRPLLLPQIVKQRKDRSSSVQCHQRRLLLPQRNAARNLRQNPPTTYQAINEDIQLTTFEAFILFGPDE